MSSVYLVDAQGHFKVSTTGRARFNPEHCIIKYVGGQQASNAHMVHLSINVHCSESIKPTNHFNTLFIA